MFIRSIRFKIILWYMLVLTLTLLLFIVLLYQNFSKKLYDDLDSLLQSRAKGIIDSIDTYWETERLEAMKDRMELNVFSKINNINFAKIAQRWVEEKTNDPKLLNIIVQIFDAKGKLISSSKNIPDIANIQKKFFNYVSKKAKHFDDVTMELKPGKQLTLRTLTIPVIENSNIAYIVVVAGQLSSIDSALKDLRLILFILLPITVIVTGVIGTFLAKITLSPFNKMVNTIHQITAENLGVRIALPDTKDEIKRLADTFNEMISRLEHAFSSQRKFIEDLTHELKTPLSILKGELEVSLKKVRSNEEYDSILRSNLEEVNRITKIVEDLLMLARFDSNAIALEIRPLDVTRL
ncbi:MAG: HAMP domain-containing protein, partial [Nitrospirae bacterium]|nr:HAMP domain-containing protein [Nitrospirota bacterium]